MPQENQPTNSLSQKWKRPTAVEAGKKNEQQQHTKSHTALFLAIRRTGSKPMRLKRNDTGL